MVVFTSMDKLYILGLPVHEGATFSYRTCLFFRKTYHGLLGYLFF